MRPLKPVRSQISQPLGALWKGGGSVIPARTSCEAYSGVVGIDLEQTQRRRIRLRDDGGKRSGDLKSGHAQVEQARDGGDAIIGVQRGEDQVASLRGFQRNFGGFFVADFADHDDVGILAQDGPRQDANVSPAFVFTCT